MVLVEETNAGDTSRPECPGGGATPVASSRRIRTDDVSNTAELSRGEGGGPPLVPSRVLVVLVEETNAGDTSRPECPGGGATSVASSRRIRTDDVSNTAELSRGEGGGPPLVPSRVLVVLVEETNAGDTSRPECPCDDQERQPLAGTYRPLGGTVSEGDTRSPYGGGGGGGLPHLVLPGGSFRWMLRTHQFCLLRDLDRFPR